MVGWFLFRDGVVCQIMLDRSRSQRTITVSSLLRGNADIAASGVCLSRGLAVLLVGTWL